jgi:hypothetical protein
VDFEGSPVAALESFFGQAGLPISPNRAGHYVVPAGSIQEAFAIWTWAESLNIAMHDHFLGRNDLPADPA